MLKIDSITFKSGSKWTPNGLNVFVGPNNSGKSRILKDIYNSLTQQNIVRLSLADIEFSYNVNPTSVLKSLFPVPKCDEYNNIKLDFMKGDYSEGQPMRVNRVTFEEALKSEAASKDFIQNGALNNCFISYLTTSSRLTVIKKLVNKNPNIAGPGSLIEMAYGASSDKIDNIRSAVKNAFDFDLTLDKDTFAEAELCVSERNTGIKQPLDEQGDGMRAFAGISVATGLGNRPIILIDEPETFLHPPQAYAIGRTIAQLSDGKRQIFVSTHSSEVLRGLTSTATQPSIVRLSRQSGSFFQTQLANNDLEKLNADPVLRSSRVLDGIFFDGVVIVESDGDEVLYRATADKVTVKPTIHYVNSYSKALSPKIFTIYNKLKVPCCVITDFDMIRIKAEFKRACEILGIDVESAEKERDKIEKYIAGSALQKDILEQLVGQLKDLVGRIEAAGPDEQAANIAINGARAELRQYRDDATAWKRFKREGISALDDSSQRAFIELDRLCKKNSLFILPAGEREAWLPKEVPYTNNKRKWTEDALNWIAHNDLPADHPLMLFVCGMIKHLA